MSVKVNPNHLSDPAEKHTARNSIFNENVFLNIFVIYSSFVMALD